RGSNSVCERDERTVVGTGVVGARADDLAVRALLDDVRGPSGRARHDEKRREHGGGYPQLVVGNGAIPVEVGKHLLLVPQQGFDPLGDLKKMTMAGGTELGGDVLDEGIAWVAHRVNWVAKSDYDLLVGNAVTNVGFGVIGRAVALLDLQRDFVGTAVLGSAERADGPRDGGIKIRTSAGNDTGGKRGRVELMLGVEDERLVEGADRCGGRRALLQELEKMFGEG